MANVISIDRKLAREYANLIGKNETSKLYGCTLAAANVRIELKAAFPGVKFSVKTSKFSMGNDMRTAWTDGPTTKEVETIADKYSGGSFDGMTDCYNYSHSSFTDMFGSAKYVNCSRHYSFEALKLAVREVCFKYGYELFVVEADSFGAHIPLDYKRESERRDVYDYMEKQGRFESQGVA